MAHSFMRGTMCEIDIGIRLLDSRSSTIKSAGIGTALLAVLLRGKAPIVELH